MRRIVSKLPVLLFFLAVSAFGCFRIIDNDLWLYLRAGEYILENLSVPRTDIFSYTVAGQPWIDIHWLAQVALYLVYAVSGAVGLTLLRCAIVLCIFALLYRCCRAFASPGIVIVVLILALLTSNDRFLIKPSLFALFLATCFIFLLERGRLSPRRLPYCLVPLQLVWANTHPSFLLGPLLVFIYFLDSLLRPSGERAASRNRLALTLALTGLACLANPYGISLFAQPFRQMSSPIYSEMIIPWTPVSFSFPAPASAFTFKLMLTLCIASVILNARGVRPAHLLTAALFGYLACSSRRHLALFALLCAPGIAYNLGARARAIGERAPRWASIFQRVTLLAVSILLIALLGEVTTSAYYEKQRSLRRFGLGKSRIAFPDSALDFIEASGIEGRLFCNYDIGSYVAGRSYPDHGVFIDGRNLVYGEELFRTYLSAMGDLEKLDELARTYRVSALLLTHGSRDVKPLLQKLWKSENWKPVFADERAVVFCRERGSPPLPRVSLSTCQLRGIPSCDKFPLPELRAGELFFTIGLTKCATEMFLSALARYPSLPEAHNFLGVIAIQEGDRKTARVEFQKAAGGSRSYAEPHINLATIFLDDGEEGKALREAVIAVEIAPSNARAHGVLGLAYMRKGKLEVAAREIREAIRLDPGDAEYHNNLGSVYDQLGDAQKALVEYERACDLSRNYFAPRFNIARLYTLREEWDRARERLEEAARIAPEEKLVQGMLEKIKQLQSNKILHGAY